MINHGFISFSAVQIYDLPYIHLYLYSSSAGGKDLSNDTQIKVTGSVEPEIRTKMLRNLSEKFPSTALDDLQC